jgi:hypothetical protein
MEQHPEFRAIAFLPLINVLFLDGWLIMKDERNGPIDQAEVDWQIEQVKETVQTKPFTSTNSLELNFCQHGLLLLLSFKWGLFTRNLDAPTVLA